MSLSLVACNQSGPSDLNNLITMMTGSFSSVVYALPDPEAAIGAWQLENPLTDFLSADLIEREGYAVYLRLQPDGSYQGSTREQECTSTLRGAVYASSEITITVDQILSWGRGWDSQEKQV